jgi:hypothetical protein
MTPTVAAIAEPPAFVTASHARKLAALYARSAYWESYRAARGHGEPGEGLGRCRARRERLFERFKLEVELLDRAGMAREAHRILSEAMGLVDTRRSLGESNGIRALIERRSRVAYAAGFVA